MFKDAAEALNLTYDGQYPSNPEFHGFTCNLTKSSIMARDFNELKDKTENLRKRFEE